MSEIATNLLGAAVEWSDSRGYHEGVIVAVTHGSGGFKLLVNVGGKMVSIYADAVRVR
jgi:hypothetical protein